jgi:hypothetical protein
MILLSSSQAVREAFKIKAVETTPVVATREWYRFWRVDLRKVRGYGEVMLFTNDETLYTFVVDRRRVRDSSDLAQQFLERFRALFEGHLGYTRDSEEEVVVHRATNQSLQGVMNSFFRMIDGHTSKDSLSKWEKRLNEVPVISRDFQRPVELFYARLRKTA